METIYLNSTNCKEYTDEEIQAIINKNDNESGFDLDMLFNDTEEVAEIEIVEEESEFVKLTKKLLVEAEKALQYWESKDYKKSNGKVYVGSELDGGTYSYNYINNKRKSDAIRNAQADIAQYKKDLGLK